MAKVNRCVVRNAAYRRGNLGDRYRHNERHNSNYGNGDIEPDRSHLNVHFKQCEGSYTDAFDKLVTDGVVSMRGLGKDPKIVDELVFDVNSAYFEDHGSYAYAKEFFAEAYRLAVKEAGGEQYILSAVMHADERNRALSDKLGRDVYHYHLHVTYVPVVDKEVRWSKRCKDPALAGTVREVIKQVSHSKKWPREKQLDENGEVVRNEKGKAVLVNSYSLLQDRFYAHMQSAGFTDFERGKKGSTAQHLSTLEYKILQDSKRAANLGEQAEALDKVVDAKRKRLTMLDKQITTKKTTAVTFGEIDGMAKHRKSGAVELSNEDWDEVSALAKKGVTAAVNLQETRRQLAAAQKDASIYRGRWEKLSKDTLEYREAVKRDPERVREALATLAWEARTARADAVRDPKRHKGSPEL